MAKVGDYSKNSKRFNLARNELRITGLMGWRTYPLPPFHKDWHNTYDYGCPQGTQLTSVFNSEVTFVDRGTSGYGYHIGLYNSELDLTFISCHMSRIDLSVGDVVGLDTVIGLSGGEKGVPGSGSSTGPHLHPILVKGRRTFVPSKSDQSIFLDIEHFDFENGGGGGIDPTTPTEIVVDIRHMDLGGNMKKGQTYKVTKVNGDSVTMELMFNEYGQMVFKDDRIEFAYYYDSPTSTRPLKPKQTRNGGRGYGRVTEVLSNTSNPYKVYTDGKFLGYVKPVNTYKTY